MLVLNTKFCIIKSLKHTVTVASYRNQSLYQKLFYTSTVTLLLSPQFQLKYPFIKNKTRRKLLISHPKNHIVCSFYISSISFSKAATKTNPHYLSIYSKSKISFHDLVISDQKQLPPEMELVGQRPVPSAGLSIAKSTCPNHKPKGVPGQLEGGLIYPHYLLQTWTRTHTSEELDFFNWPTQNWSFRNIFHFFKLLS